MSSDAGLRGWANEAIVFVYERSTGTPVDPTVRVTLNFHPDHQIDDRNVVQSLASDGVYRSQFETGTSNGGLTARLGGNRWLWEQRMFGHTYDDAPLSQRPKCGALNHRARSIGGAPRFGSSHLRLSKDTLGRTTFCFSDSVFKPRDFGTSQRQNLIALADEFDKRQLTDVTEAEEGGVLDDYIEAHIHGEIRIASDVEAIVLDPSFKGTQIEEQAQLLGVPVEWHHGRQLAVAELSRHPSFRGPHIVEVGSRVAVDGWLNARIIGAARHRAEKDLQDLKKVWHHVARFGSPTNQ